MNEQPIVVLITAPSPEVAEEIATMLVERRLAACANIINPVRSLFTWQGQVSDERETLLIVKSRADLFEGQLVPAVKEIHPYETPEIIALPVILGAPDYLTWIREVTAPASHS